MNDRIHHVRLGIVFFFMLSGLAAVSGRLIMLHTGGEADEVRARTALKSRVTVLPHIRGRIADRNDEVLVSDTEVFRIVVDRGILRTGKDRPMLTSAIAWHELSQRPDFLAKSRSQQLQAMRSYAASLNRIDDQEIINQHLDLVVEAVARPLGLTPETVRERIMKGSPRGEVILDKGVPRDVATMLRDDVERMHLAGLIFRSQTKRRYTRPDLAAHTIGYMSEVVEMRNGKEVPVVKAVAGIEKICDEWLTGIDGRRVQNVDSRGLPVARDPGKRERPRDGHHVQLTIDARLQQIVEEEMMTAKAEADMVRGSILMLDPKTGDILAVATYPSFDLATRENIGKAYYHYALQGVYEPGSTFKVVAAAAALQEGTITTESLIDCHYGYYREDGVRPIEDTGRKMSKVTTGEILAHSSNVGSFMIVDTLGARRFQSYVKKFGFLNGTGLNLYGDPAGAVQPLSNRENLSRVSYGYSISCSPLQMALAYGAIANGGMLMKPRLVKRVVTREGVVLHDPQPEAMHQVLSGHTAATMRELLAGVVHPRATGKRAQVAGFRVAGKTGTANLIAPNGDYLTGRNTASFVGMMPADDPAFVCVVVLGDPQTTEKEAYGGVLAAPVFARIAERAASVLNLQPDLPTSMAKPPLAQTP